MRLRPWPFNVALAVEGLTLAERPACGPIPLTDALRIAAPDGRRVEHAAREKGVVYRDLKPANIKLIPDGDVKILDFGCQGAVGVTPDTEILGLMRPSAVTAVASVNARAPPPIAQLPAYTRSRSLEKPSTLEYWHLGDTTIRLARVRPRSGSGIEEVMDDLPSPRTRPIRAGGPAVCARRA